jgi:gp45 sliding clamp, C terminal
MEKYMKLSNETLAVLKNFSSINQGIQFKKGKKIATVSSSKTVLAQAVLADDFPQDFCIYDLNQFLAVHGLFKDGADIDFDSSNVIFKGGKSKVKYRMTDKNMIVTPPEKEIVLPSVDCSFTLTQDDLEWIMKTSSVLSSPHIAIQSDGDTINLLTFDAADDSAHTNSIELGEGNGKTYKVVFKTENIKLIPGSYEVDISFKGIGHFKNVKDDIDYWIAFESKESEVK